MADFITWLRPITNAVRLNDHYDFVVSGNWGRSPRTPYKSRGPARGTARNWGVGRGYEQPVVAQSPS